MTNECSQCGQCCSLVLGTATENDILRYQDHPRLAKYLEAGYLMEGMYDLWISPVTGEDFERCPFVRSNKCTIYKDRPDVCRAFSCAYMEGTGTIEIPLKTITDGVNV